MVDQAEQTTAPGRRADRRGCGDHRAHARVPLGRRDGPHADLGADRPGGRAAAAAVRQRVRRLPQLRADARRHARARRGHRLRAADRRALPGAAGER